MVNRNYLLDYVEVSINYIGFVDPIGVEGFVELISESGKIFPIRAFSGEVVKHIHRFLDGDRDETPTIYKLIFDIAELKNLRLSDVEIYESGKVLRANLHFKNGNEVLPLRNYRASDAIALATYYGAKIKLRRDLLDNL